MTAWIAFMSGRYSTALLLMLLVYRLVVVVVPVAGVAAGSRRRVVIQPVVRKSSNRAASLAKIGSNMKHSSLFSSAPPNRQSRRCRDAAKSDSKGAYSRAATPPADADALEIVAVAAAARTAAVMATRRASFTSSSSAPKKEPHESSGEPMAQFCEEKEREKKNSCNGDHV